jgi:formylglycine-generating enzyme required for sulfatase activity
MKKLTRFLISVLLITISASSCRSDTPPALGDIYIRPTDEMVMVFVPGGGFMMGSDDGEVDAALEMCNIYYGDCKREWFEVEQPAHSVTLDDFWIDQTEVTNAQYRGCVEAGDCDPPTSASSDTRATYYNDDTYDAYPVVNVNWHQASTYCEWAGGRLPTEAEWEYAARGPGESWFPWGDEYDGAKLNSCDVNCAYDWAETENDDGHSDTAPVGSYPNGASWCGALDMAGNVWEWVADRFGEYAAESQANPTGPTTGLDYTLRGDSADGTRAVSRSAARHGMRSSRTYAYTGFRCVRSKTP